MRALSTAATGMMAMELNVQVIANNLANMTTTGYKRQRAEFQDLLYDHVSRIGTQTSAQGNILPVGIDLGSGVKSVGTPRLMTQGTLSQTGGTLDVAIRGDGFFKVQLPDGTYAYTRDGSFQMDATGRIVTPQGNPVMPTITIPQNSTGLTINAQGQVSVIPQGSDHADHPGAAHPHPLHQPGRPAADRRQHVHRDAGLRHAAGRQPQHRRRRRLDAGKPRAVECQLGHRDHQSDRRAARL